MTALITQLFKELKEVLHAPTATDHEGTTASICRQHHAILP